jgi:hypothetical protein
MREELRNGPQAIDRIYLFFSDRPKTSSAVAEVADNPYPLF